MRRFTEYRSWNQNLCNRFIRKYMRTLFLLSVLLLGFTSGSVYSQGMVFFEGSWSEVQAKAKAENKHIFVDAYTDWCGPCKMMAKQVFPLPEVGTFYNKNFINYKLNMEKGDGVDFAKTFQVGVYPSYLFFNASGFLLHRTVGYKQGPQFIADGAAALDTTRQLITNIRKYQTGNRNADVLYHLAVGLSEAGAPDANIEGEYWKTQTGDLLYSAQNFSLLSKKASGYRGEEFRILLGNRAKFGKAVSDQEVNTFLSSTLFRALQYAVGNRMDALTDSVMNDIKTFDSPLREEYLSYAEVIRNAGSSDRDAYYALVVAYMESYGHKNEEKLNAYSQELLSTNRSDYAVLVLKWLESGLPADPGIKRLELLSQASLISGDRVKAKMYAQRGIEFAAAQNGDDTLLKQYLEQAKQ
jgi:thioredoxin-related protein